MLKEQFIAQNELMNQLVKKSCSLIEVNLLSTTIKQFVSFPFTSLKFKEFQLISEREIVSDSLICSQLFFNLISGHAKYFLT